MGMADTHLLFDLIQSISFFVKFTPASLVRSVHRAGDRNSHHDHGIQYGPIRDARANSECVPENIQNPYEDVYAGNRMVLGKAEKCIQLKIPVNLACSSEYSNQRHMHANM